MWKIWRWWNFFSKITAGVQTIKIIFHRNSTKFHLHFYFYYYKTWWFLKVFHCFVFIFSRFYDAFVWVERHNRVWTFPWQSLIILWLSLHFMQTLWFYFDILMLDFEYCNFLRSQMKTYANCKLLLQLFKLYSWFVKTFPAGNCILLFCCLFTLMKKVISNLSKDFIRNSFSNIFCILINFSRNLVISIFSWLKFILFSATGFHLG